LKKEKVIVAFTIEKSGKLVSVCEGTTPSYLVYRFGKQSKIELQIPARNAKSWSFFRFDSRTRPGGPTEGGFGEYSLRFSNQQADYTILQNWNNATQSYGIAVAVDTNKKSVLLKGAPNSQIGSLVLLETEAEKIPNGHFANE